MGRSCLNKGPASAPAPGVPAALVLAFASLGGPARAGEVVVGVFDHAVFAPPQSEHGEDIMLGWRSDPIRGWTGLARPSIDVTVSANDRVATDFVAVGFSWRLAIADRGRLYLRPGFGVAYTNGEAGIGNAYQPDIDQAERERRLHLASTRIDFGSHDLFNPQIALGFRITRSLSLEAAYDHLSNGQIFHHGKNQGLDDAGLRVAYRY
jgi:hypothetical protein